MYNKIIKEAEKFMKENVPKTRIKESYLRHVLGARDYAVKLAKIYDVDLFVIEIAALLHDVGAYAGKEHHKESVKIAEKFLSKFDISEDIKKRILKCIEKHAYWDKAENIEQQIIQDADGIIFLEDTYRYYLEKQKKKFPLEEAKKLSVKKIKVMREKIKTEKGVKIAEKFYEKALKDV